MIRFLLTRFIRIVALATPTPFLCGPTLGMEPNAEQLNWIKKNAIAFTTPIAGNGFEDLQGLKELVGNARVVALGEGTHGTREFFQMKHRLVEFLANEMGFTIFSIEANMPEAYRLNDFVLHGRGDPKELIKGMYFWTWNTHEVLDMVLWMREFNQSGKGRIEFTGFDMQTPNVAAQIVTEFLRNSEPTMLSEVEGLYGRVAELGRTAGRDSFGVCTGTFPHQMVAGKRIKFSGFIKTEDVKDGFAGLWWRADGSENKQLAFDNMGSRGVMGTTDWQEYTIELDIPIDVININFGALLTGSGTAWFDGLKVEFGSQQWLPWPAYDPDFESEAGHGFFTGGPGYRIMVDPITAHSGSKSLRMFCEGKSTGLNPQEVAGHCRTVLTRLESNREKYVANQPATGVDWAIQNARVVLQCAQMHAGLQSRDESMARNVEWILDHAPSGTKIVLWAHNGHVTRAPYFGEVAQGGYLSRRFKDELVVFGFACNEGRYTAVGQAGLDSHPLQLSRPGSIEDFCHRTGLPRFILDLRKASRDSIESGWLKSSIPMRSIGAGAMEEQFFPVIAPDAYDALIYIDKTEASWGLWK